MATLQAALRKSLRVLPEVADALSSGRPVVALESTIVAHGMPYPQNLDLARDVSRILRERVREGPSVATPRHALGSNNSRRLCPSHLIFRVLFFFACPFLRASYRRP
jgi:hypothetical protein